MNTFSLLDLWDRDKVEYDVTSEVEKMDRGKSEVGIPKTVAGLSE